MFVTQTPGPVLETAEIDISSCKHRRVGKKSRVCEVLLAIMLVYIIMCEHSFSSLLFWIPYRIFLLSKTCWLVCRMICHCSVRLILKLVCKKNNFMFFFFCFFVFLILLFLNLFLLKKKKKKKKKKRTRCVRSRKWIMSGDTNEIGDVGESPGESSLFLLTTWFTLESD
jgi:predicted membrane protein